MTTLIQESFNKLGEASANSFNKQDKELISLQMSIIEDGMIDSIKTIGALLEQYAEVNGTMDLPDCDCAAMGKALLVAADTISGLRAFQSAFESSITIRQVSHG